MKFQTMPHSETEYAEIEHRGDTYVVSMEMKPCVKCQCLTRWVSQALHAHLCSTECADAYWGEYQMATEFIK